MQRHWKSPAHPARHRRDYIIYRAVEDASPDGRYLEEKIFRWVYE